MQRLIIILAIFLYSPVYAGDLPASHGIAVFGKLKYSSDFKNFEYVNPTAKKGGQAKLAFTGTFDSLNPYIIKGNKAPLVSMVFESLMIASLDEPQSMYGLVAKSAKIAQDHGSVEFVMRPEARFHDGSPITADDVVFSFNILKKEGEPSLRISYEPIASAEKLDDNRVRFNFSDKQKRELPLLAASVPILSKKYYETREFNKTTLEAPLASGAYKVKSFEVGRSITYERVKNYWAAKLPVNIGQNNFDIIKVDLYRDDTVSLEAFKNGSYDFREENIARVWATGYDCKALQDGRIKREVMQHKIPQGMQGFAFNVRKHKFSDRRVREAIAASLDFEWMNKSLFFGAYKRNMSFFQNTPYAANDLPNKDEIALFEPYRNELPPRMLEQKFALPISDSSGNNRPLLINADKLLNDAGWIIKDGKRVNQKSGEQLKIEFIFQSPSYERVAAPMRKALKRLGIEASIRIVDDAQYIKRLETFDYDLIMSVFNKWVFFPGNEQNIYWHSSQASQEGSNNVVGVTNPIIDALLAKITSAKSEEELLAPARALDRLLLWEHYTIPNWYLGAFRLAYWDKFAKPTIMPKYSSGFPQIWWEK